MNRITSRNFSANEKEIDKLLKEIAGWREELSYISEEIHFLHLFLKAEVFSSYDENLYNSLGEFENQVEDFLTEDRDLIKEVHNHRYDIEGILECEDISCEVFYHEEHLKLARKIRDFAERFRKYKLEVFSYTSDYLKIRKNIS